MQFAPPLTGWRTKDGERCEAVSPATTVGAADAGNASPHAAATAATHLKQRVALAGQEELSAQDL